MAPNSPAAPQVTPQDSIRDWKIYFKPGPDLFSHGTNPLLLLRELRALGQLQVNADFSGVPPLSEMNPESCYLAWNMVLSTSEPQDAIRDVFVFVGTMRNYDSACRRKRCEHRKGNRFQ